MSIKDNFPALKPSLSLDFANTKTLDPRITFSRASTGTYYDGVTHAKAEENLLLNSQDYSSEWTVTDLTATTGITAPDGTSTATEFAASSANGVLTQGYTAVAGDYTFSVWLRRVTGTGNIQIAADNGTWTTKTITGTWDRYDVTQTVAAGSKTAGVRVVTSGDEIEVWGAQLEQRSSVTAYTATTTQPITNYIPVLQSAAAGEARFDHDPVTGESKGLLIEEQRTNLLTYSEDFSNAAWTKSNTSVDSNVIVAPDGTLTGDKLIADSGQTDIQLQYNGLSNTGALVASIYVKKESARYFVIANRNYLFAGRIWFDLDTGTIAGQTQGSGAITPVGNGWYRISFAFDSFSVSFVQDLVFYLDSSFTDVNTAPSFTGDGYSGIFIWGAQLEAGAFPTSYIKTTSAQATRNADSASMTGTNFSEWYRQDEGTLFAEALSLSSTYAYVAQLRSESTADIDNIYLRKQNTGGSLGAIRIGAAFEFQGSGSTWSTAQSNKLIIAYKRNDVAFTDFGGSVVTSSSSLVPEGVTTLGIGVNQSGTLALNGTLKRLTYYPLRLTNAQLQALTEG